MYIIQRLDQSGGYLAPTGQGQVWVRDLRRARTFATFDSAKAECCPENERPVNINSLLKNPEN